MKRAAVMVACVAGLVGAIFFFTSEDPEDFNPLKLVKQEVVKKTLLADLGL